VFDRLKARFAPPLGVEDVSVQVHLREGTRWYVQLAVRTTNLAFLVWGPVEIMDAPSDAELGAAVGRALARAPARQIPFVIDDDRETPWSREGRKFRSFARGAALVEVTRRADGRFSVMPYENREFTKPREGFVGVSERARDVEDDDEQLGAAIRAAAAT
jgi:hypothetical protein